MDKILDDIIAKIDKEEADRVKKQPYSKQTQEKVKQRPPVAEGALYEEGTRNSSANNEAYVAGLKQDPELLDNVKAKAREAGLPDKEVEYTTERAYKQGAEKSDGRQAKPKAPRNGHKPPKTLRILSRPRTTERPKRLPEVARFLGTREQITIIAGLGGVGKTSLLLLASYCVASDTSFMGRKVQHGKVIFISDEGKDVLDEMMSELPQCKDMIHNWDGSIETIEALNEVTAMDNVAMIIIDPAIIAQSWFGMKEFKENSSTSWAELINAHLKPLASRTNALVVLLHHTRKAQPKGGNDTARSFIRGSGACVDIADNVGVLLADGDDRTLELVKRRGGRRLEKVRLTLELKEITQKYDTGETETFHAVIGGACVEDGLPCGEPITNAPDDKISHEELLQGICTRMYAKRESYTTSMGYIPATKIVGMFSSGQRTKLRQDIYNLLYYNSLEERPDQLFRWNKDKRNRAYTLRSGPEGPCPDGVISDIAIHWVQD